MGNILHAFPEAKVQSQGLLVKCTGNPRVHLGLPVPLPNKTHTRLPGTGILTGQLSATHGYGDNRTRGGLPTGLRANL